MTLVRIIFMDKSHLMYTVLIVCKRNSKKIILFWFISYTKICNVLIIVFVFALVVQKEDSVMSTADAIQLCVIEDSKAVNAQKENARLKNVLAL